MSLAAVNTHDSQIGHSQDGVGEEAKGNISSTKEIFCSHATHRPAGESK